MERCVEFVWWLWWSWWSWLLWIPPGIVAQPGRDCLALCSGNFTCAMSCAACDYDCCSSACNSARIGDICDGTCYSSTLNVSSCCVPAPAPPPLPAPIIPGPGNCSAVSVLAGSITLIEGTPFSFTIIGIDSSCSGSTCSCTTPFVGAPSFFQVVITNAVTGIIPPKTVCTVSNGSSSGIFPVSCLAQNSYADATTQYILTVNMLSYGSWVSPIGFTNPFLYIIAGPISVPACMATWFNGSNTFAAGSEAKLYIVQKDAFNNTVGSKTGRTEVYNFVLAVIASPHVNTSIYFETFSITADANAGIQTVTFYPEKEGSFYLQIGNQSQVIQKSPFPFNVVPGPLSINESVASWPNGINTFEAGTTASLAILQVDQYGNPIADPELTLEMFFLEDNTKADLNVTMSVLEIDTDYLNASFSPTLAGQYSLHVGNGTQEIPASPFTFSVVSGPVSIQNCIGSWVDNSTFQAGARASFKVMQMDAYNNNVSLATGNLEAFKFAVSVCNADDGQPVPMSSLMLLPGELGSAYRTIVYSPTLAGSFLLNVGSGSANISMSPFPFEVLPGPISISVCMAIWPNGSQFEAGSTGSLQVLKRDKYNNSVFDNYEFLATVISYSSDIPVGSLPDFGVQVQNMNGTDYNSITFISTLSGEFAFIIGSNTDTIANSPVPFLINASSVSTSSCIAKWPRQLNKFPAGSEARLEILLKDMFNNTVSLATGGYDPNYELSASVLGSPNALQELPAYNVTLVNDGNAGLKIVKFYPKVAGQYWLSVWSSTENITGSPFPFTVTAGSIAVLNCTASWLGGVNSFDAGSQAVIQVLLMDNYGNNVSIATGRNDSYNFAVEIVGYPDALSAWSVTVVPQNFSGYQSVVFFPIDTGKFQLRIGSKSKNISGSPFSFTVNPGPLSIPDCSGEWPDGIQYFLQNGTVAFFIYPRDGYGNDVSSNGLNQSNFTALVYFATNLVTLPVSSMVVVPRDNYSLLMTFPMTQVGRFILQVGNASEDIAGSPFVFTITTDNVDQSRTIIEGDGLKNSTAGGQSIFLVQLRDSAGNRAAANLTDMSVAFLRFGLPIDLTVNISVIPKSSGVFQISYTAVLVGEYKILVKWRGIVLGAGPAIKKNVLPGNIFGPWCTGSDLSNGQAGLYYDFQVMTVDPYNNTNPTGPAVLSVNFSPPASETKIISRNGDGTFNVRYNITKAGTYSMAVLAGSGTASDPINGSPFQVTIAAGPVSVSSCRGMFKDGPVISAGRPVRFIVMLRDRFNNKVYTTDIHILEMFEASVYFRTGTNPLYIPDMAVQIFGTTILPCDQLLVAFTLQEIGEYRLEVGDGTVNIVSRAPHYFSIVQEAPSLSNSSFSGTGLKNSTAGDVSSVSVTLCDQFGKPVIADPSLLVINVTMGNSSYLLADVFDVDSSLGKYQANYTATKAGDYGVFVSWSGVLMAVFYKTVLPGPVSVEGCRPSGTGLYGGIAGSNLTFNVSVYDAFRNSKPTGSISLLIKFEPDVGTNLTLATTWAGNGIFEARYAIAKAQPYLMSVVAITLGNEQPIPGSPFQIVINPGEPQANSSVMTGEGCSMLASIYKWNELIISMTDSYENPAPLDAALFSITVEGPGNCTYQSFTPAADQKYIASYKPSAQGMYRITIMYGGVALAGNPFNVTVGSARETAKDFIAVIQPMNSVLAGEEVNISISSSYSNNLTTVLNLTVELVSSSYNQTVIPDVQQNGSYVAVLNITNAALYNVVVALYGSSINGTYSLQVDPGGVYVPNCESSVDSLSAASVGIPQNVTVQAKDRFGNDARTDADDQGVLVNFTMILSGPMIQDFPLLYQSDGTFVGSFVASQLGSYDLSIMSELTQIKSSPFLVTVS